MFGTKPITAKGYKYKNLQTIVNLTHYNRNGVHDKLVTLRHLWLFRYLSLVKMKLSQLLFGKRPDTQQELNLT